jgi:hypothetical protein
MLSASMPTSLVACNYLAPDPLLQINIKLLWLMVSRPVCPGVRSPSGAHDQFFFSSPLKLPCASCGFVIMGHPLWWEVSQVCSFWLLLGLVNTVFLRSESRGILLSQFWNIPGLEGEVPVFISPRNRVSQLYPQALGPLAVDPHYIASAQTS